MDQQLIVARAPLRVSLFGGGTDFFDYYKKKDAKILSFSIQKYIYVILKERDDNFFYINYFKKEITNKIKHIQHDIIREVLKYFKIKKGIEISILSDIPSKGSGLGSSSALCCALILSVSKYSKIKLSQFEIGKIATKIEIDILKKPIGVQDQYGCAIGGIKKILLTKNEIKIQKIENSKLKKIIEKYSILYDTKKNRKSEEILQSQKKSISINFDKLNQINEISKNFISYELKNLNHKSFISSLNKSWELKKKLDKKINNNLISKKINYLKRKGFVGFKLCGAGIGGFIFATKIKKIDNENNSNIKKIKIDLDGVRLI